MVLREMYNWKGMDECLGCYFQGQRAPPAPIEAKDGSHALMDLRAWRGCGNQVHMASGLCQQHLAKAQAASKQKWTVDGIT